MDGALGPSLRLSLTAAVLDRRIDQPARHDQFRGLVRLHVQKDHVAAGDFERALIPLLDPAAGSRAGVVVDLAGVEYISSVGLRVLMIATKSVRGRGARFAVAELQPIVREIFAISRFDAILEVCPSLRAALERASPAALAAFDAAQRPAGS